MNEEPANPEILLRHDSNGVCTLTMNRPAQFNALSEDLLEALAHQLACIAEETQTRIVVLAGAGEAFCAGHDLKQMMHTPQQDYYQQLFERSSRVTKRIMASPKPVIAKVQGMATAAGCQLVAACDLAIASTNATFAVSGIRLGLFCSTPSVALSRNISRKQAFEMLMTGDFIDASTAQSRGLINHAVAPEALDQAVSALCAQIMQHPPVAVETGKLMFYKQLEMPVEQAYQFAATTMARNMMATDALEGGQAFIDKRLPSWKHRA